jgi:hypothetical protein
MLQGPQPSLPAKPKVRGDVEIVVDSGSEVHVCPPGFGGSARSTIIPSKRLRIRAAGGQQLHHYGEVVDVRRPTLSVSALARRGYPTAFVPDGAYLLSRSGSRLPLHRSGGLYVLRATIDTDVSDRVKLSVMAAEAPDDEYEVPDSGGAASSTDRKISDVEDVQAGADRKISDIEDLQDVPRREGAQPRPLKELEAPSPADQHSHALVHIPSQSWCDQCVRARAKEDPHRSRSLEEKLLARVDEPSAVEIDFTWIGALTGLSIYTREVGGGAMTVVPSKRAEAFVVRWCCLFLNFVGLGDITFVHDQETSIRALAEAVASRRRSRT